MDQFLEARIKDNMIQAEKDPDLFELCTPTRGGFFQYCSLCSEHFITERSHRRHMMDEHENTLLFRDLNTDRKERSLKI